MRRIPMLVAFLLSCGPAEQRPHEVYQVSAAGLVAYYRDNPRGAAYTRQRTQVRLEPGSYSIDGNEVLYYTGVPRTPPVVVFRCIDPPTADPVKHWLVLSGMCSGAVRDGIRKADRVAFTIHVEECHVTRLEIR